MLVVVIDTSERLVVVVTVVVVFDKDKICVGSQPKMTFHWSAASLLRYLVLICCEAQMDTLCKHWILVIMDHLSLEEDAVMYTSSESKYTWVCSLLVSWLPVTSAWWRWTMRFQILTAKILFDFFVPMILQ